MAIVRAFGKPDLFITMTCNPAWEEVTQALLLNQRPEDRPDILARVFQMKLKSLLTDLDTKGKGIFGRTLAKLMVVEFQKRGE